MHKLEVLMKQHSQLVGTCIPATEEDDHSCCTYYWPDIYKLYSQALACVTTDFPNIMMLMGAKFCRYKF